MRYKLAVAAVIAIGVFQSCKSTESTETTGLTDDQKSSYAVGLMIGENMKNSGVDSLDIDYMSKAVGHVLNGDSIWLSDEDKELQLKTFFEDVQKRKTEKLTKEGVDFLAANKLKEGVIETESGLQYKIIKKGVGAFPKATDKVEVHYEGKLLDGKVFDSSFQRGQTIEFPLNGVIKGWTEGLQYINEGGEIELYIPYDLAYGERGAGQDIPPFSTLVFKVQLVSIVAASEEKQQHFPGDGHNH